MRSLPPFTPRLSRPAPGQVMVRAPYDGAKADLWSAGVVLFIMIAGRFPNVNSDG